MQAKGWIYFIRCREFVKVGHSENPEYRLHELMKAVPFKMELIAKFPAQRPLEKFVHRALTPIRSKGEWYKWSEVFETIIKTGIIALNTHPIKLLPEIDLHNAKLIL